MTDAVRHALQAHAHVTGPSRNGQTSQLRPDVFGGVVYLVDEIKKAVGACEVAAMQLGAARMARDLGSMHCEHAKLTKALDQLRQMNESLGWVLDQHVNLQNREAGHAG